MAMCVSMPGPPRDNSDVDDGVGHIPVPSFVDAVWDLMFPWTTAYESRFIELGEVSRWNAQNVVLLVRPGNVGEVRIRSTRSLTGYCVSEDVLLCIKMVPDGHVVTRLVGHDAAYLLNGLGLQPSFHEMLAHFRRVRSLGAGSPPQLMEWLRRCWHSACVS